MPQAGNSKIGILGDLLIDTTYYVDVFKTSPEAPILVYSLSKDLPISSPGGAGLAASYASKYTIPYVLLSCFNAEKDSILKDRNISYIQLEETDVITKTRYIDKTSGYHLARIEDDRLILSKIKLDHEKILKKIVDEILRPKKIKVLSMLDYCKGLFNPDFNRELIKECKRHEIKTYVDTRGNPLNFNGIDTLKLNQKEYVSACTNLNIKDQREMISCLNLQKLLISKGKDGATIYIEDKKYDRSTNKYMGIPNVTGYGDVLDINFCYYYYLKGYRIEDALTTSIYAASRYAHEPIETRL